jgi:hypothetical protein
MIKKQLWYCIQCGNMIKPGVYISRICDDISIVYPDGTCEVHILGMWRVFGELVTRELIKNWELLE